MQLYIQQSSRATTIFRLHMSIGKEGGTFDSIWWNKIFKNMDGWVLSNSLLTLFSFFWEKGDMYVSVGWRKNGKILEYTWITKCPMRLRGDLFLFLFLFFFNNKDESYQCPPNPYLSYNWVRLRYRWSSSKTGFGGYEGSRCKWGLVCMRHSMGWWESKVLPKSYK